MYDLNEFYLQAHSGEKVDSESLIKYIRSFKNIILWGAGNLGKAVGEKLLNESVCITEYWDKNFENIKICNGIKVCEPFAKTYNPDETCVIGCIVNGSLGEEWVKNETLFHGYSNYIYGMSFFEGIICPLNKEYIDITECTKRKACSLCNCKRYVNLMNHKLESEDNLSFQLLTFIISSRCTLNCKYCGQRLAYYNKEDKKDIDIDIIKRDFDNIMDSVDFIGMISVIGGEPFIHPKLVDIVNYMLKRGNFGVVNITTNGVVKITKEQLNALKNDRVKISFSIYDTYLSDSQKETLRNNIELVDEMGINYSVSKPLWVKPANIEKCNYTESELDARKQNCSGIKMQISVKDGYIYVCGVADSMEGIHIADAGTGKLNIMDKNNLKEKLKQWCELPHYDCCDYCCNGDTTQIIAGEQYKK